MGDSVDSVDLPHEMWRIWVPGNLPLTFFDESAVRGTYKHLKKAGHKDIRIKYTVVGPWRDYDFTEYDTA